MDTLGFRFEALGYPACSKLLRPLAPHGVRVPGTRFQLDPVSEAFDIAAMNRWLNDNDAWPAADQRIDALGAKIRCVEEPRFSRDYLDPEKRSIANTLTVRLTDGTVLDEVEVEYPLGHRRRRAEGIPLLIEKLKTNLARVFPPAQAQAILALCSEAERLACTPVNEFVDLLVP